MASCPRGLPGRVFSDLSLILGLFFGGFYRVEFGFLSISWLLRLSRIEVGSRYDEPSDRIGPLDENPRICIGAPFSCVSGHRGCCRVPQDNAGTRLIPYS